MRPTFKQIISSVQTIRNSYLPAEISEISYFRQSKTNGEYEMEDFKENHTSENSSKSLPDPTYQLSTGTIGTTS